MKSRRSLLRFSALTRLSLIVTIAISALVSSIRGEEAIAVREENGEVRVTWPASAGEVGLAVFNLDEHKPLIQSLALGRDSQTTKAIVTALDPVTLLTIGTRDAQNPQGWGAFFDKVPLRPYETFPVTLGSRRLRVTREGTRATVSVAEASAGSFRGDVRFTFYPGSALVRAETVMSTQEDWRAIVYDAGLASATPDWQAFAWKDTAGQLQRAKLDPNAEAAPIAVAGRTIVAEGAAGSLAIFPPPHQYFYPLDNAQNLKFVWAGKNYGERVSGVGFGIRQPPSGDKRFVPWFNAPPGSEQHLSVFYLLSSGHAQQALDAVAQYTHGDHFKKLPGYFTFTSHYHMEHTREVLAKQQEQKTEGVPRGLESPDFVQTFKARGVNIAHLAEFHYGDGSKVPEAERLQRLKTLHSECARLSDDELLVLPGEEPNVHLGGHWISLFPKPVNWTLSRPEGKPFAEEIAGYGTVYHVGSPADVLALFEKEHGLFWTAHARIKSSFGFPDNYKDTAFYRSDRFLGAAWKAMPADLSRSTLGWRVLDLLDASANWGAHKQAIGEVDIFGVHPDYETYGHMNINYLRLAKLPHFADGWQPVLDALRGGQFFTTTGEILIPEFSVGGKQSGQMLDVTHRHSPPALEAHLDWTFPLAFAEVVSGDGQKVYRQRIELTDTSSFGTRVLRVPLELKDRTWVRFEVWDVAANGAFTQPVWLAPQ